MKTENEKLNQTIELREKMIYAILYSKRRTDYQYYKMEEKLFHSSYKELKKKYELLTR